MRRLRLLTLLACLSPALAIGADWQTETIPASPKVTETAAGTVWYRAYLKVGKNLVEPSADAKDLWRESMTLALQDIPGAFEISLNGKVIIKGTNVPADAPKRFKVPKDILQADVFNVLAIRLHGESARRGLSMPPVFGGYLDEVVLDRDWQVRRGDAAPEDFSPVPNSAPPTVAAYSEKDWRKANTVLQAPDEPVRGRQVPPAEALSKLQAGEGLMVESLLHEPAVAQPTHVSYDGSGRMWIAQYRQYPYPAGLKMISRDAYYRGKYDKVPPAPPYHDAGADIVSVHEDRDGDGKYEHQKQVLTGLNMANAVLHGHGGIWVMHTPYLLFYPDTDGDDVPDRHPEVRLAGFGLEDTHSTANGLAWGPDGWLYGAQGSTVTSHVRRPDVDKPEAKPLYLEGCAVWRYHPETKEFEIFADGSGNTFGLHFDSEGRLFSGHNGGNTRGWHHIQEGQYLKQGTAPDKFGPPTNPFAFGQMPAMRATHPVPRFSHNIIMMEGSAIPPNWRGQMLGADPLHQHLVASKRILHGSTFETTDTGHPVKADDMTFRPVYMTNAPDGSITIADFREEYIAHGQNYQGQIDPNSGRIYRFRGKDLPLESDTNLASKSAEDLIKTLQHPNHWHRHTAARLLAAHRDADTRDALKKMVAQNVESNSNHPALEALWALHQSDGLDEATAIGALKHAGPMVRAWSIRLMGDKRTLSAPFLEAVVTLAATEADAEVRSQILSTAKRLPVAQALPLVKAILQRDVDTQDPFIPLMAWFVLEPHCTTTPDLVTALMEKDATLWQRQIVREHITPRLMRRFAASGTRHDLARCAALLRMAPSPEDAGALMQGFEEAFKGRAMPPLPDELVGELAKLGKGSLLMRVRQNDEGAIQEALKIVEAPTGSAEDRMLFTRTFGEVRTPAAVPLLLKVTHNGKDPVELRKLALGSLVGYDSAEIGMTVATTFPSLPVEMRDAALNLLASRSSWTLSMLDSVEKGTLPKDSLTPELLARLRLHKDKAVTERLAIQFPAPPPQTRESLRPRMEQVRAVLGKGPGDPYAGEAIYTERCAACHKLFHKGGNVGPNLTTYQREDLGTMLVSIIDPNAEIREGYANYFVTTKDGRTLGGFLADQDNHVIVLRGFDGNDITLQRTEISNMQAAGSSLMPEGLLEKLTDKQLRDLFAYLRISQPITK